MKIRKKRSDEEGVGRVGEIGGLGTEGERFGAGKEAVKGGERKG